MTPATFSSCPSVMYSPCTTICCSGRGGSDLLFFTCASLFFMRPLDKSALVGTPLVGVQRERTPTRGVPTGLEKENRKIKKKAGRNLAANRELGLVLDFVCRA